MAIEFSSTGQTVVTWTLTDSGESASREAAYRTTRDISHGTGPNQATCAYARRLTITGAGVLLDPEELDSSVYGLAAYTSFSSVREMLVYVVSGPTGGHIVFGGPTGSAGATGLAAVGVGVGGQLHWVDYAPGVSGGANREIRVSPGVTGTYTVDLTIVGLGSIISAV